MTEMKEASQAVLQEGARLLRDGALVAFPTETVYGLGADGLNPCAVQKIFEAKNRPADNPLILHIADMASLDLLVRKVDPKIKEKLQHFWPGPLTAIFKKSSAVPAIVTAGGNTVAIRMPKHETALSLIAEAGRPLAAPSANKSGRPSPTRASDVMEDMDGAIPLIIDAGECSIGIESTVLDLTVDPPCILRPGYYTESDLRQVFPDVYTDPVLKGIPKSPGQKYRHYAPKAPMTVFTGKKEAVKPAMEEAIQREMPGRRIGLLVFSGEEPDRLVLSGRDIVLLVSGKRDNGRALARSLFANLREFDRREVDVIFAAGYEEDDDLRASVMNRVKKSAQGNLINVK